jgi:hypothetical protein
MLNNTVNSLHYKLSAGAGFEWIKSKAKQFQITPRHLQIKQKVVE